MPTQTATFQQPDAIEMGEYDYSRRWVQALHCTGRRLLQSMECWGCTRGGQATAGARAFVALHCAGWLGGTCNVAALPMHSAAATPLAQFWRRCLHRWRCAARWQGVTCAARLPTWHACGCWGPARAACCPTNTLPLSLLRSVVNGSIRLTASCIGGYHACRARSVPLPLAAAWQPWLPWCAC